MKNSSCNETFELPTPPRPGNRCTGLLAALAVFGSGLAAAADPGPFRQVSAGYGHTCAVTEAGEAWCWGNNSSGQLGQGIVGGYTNRPFRVSTSTPGFGSDNIAWIDAGGGSTCAVTTSGQAFCWGGNRQGTLGIDRRTLRRDVPWPVDTAHPRFGDDNVVSLGRNGLRGSATCALTDAGQAFCWGQNHSGQVGVGHHGKVKWRPRSINTDAPGLTRRNVAQISAGILHGCALNQSGRAFCWGSNAFGQLGDRTRQGSRKPVRVLATAPGLRGAQIAAIGSGENFTCALTDAGRVACWGRNDRGQLGNGTTRNRAVPWPVRTERLPFRRGRIAQIDVGAAHACALTDTGRAFCWGSNASGRLGIGRHPIGPSPTGTPPRTEPDFLSSPTPVDTSTPGFRVNNIAAISAGADHTCALNDSGVVFCWGGNRTGQAGGPDLQEVVWLPRRVRFPSD